MNTVLSLMLGDDRPVEDFTNSYRCYSFDMHEGSDSIRETLRCGGHILLPQSALRDMSIASAASGASAGPMIFRLSRGSQSVLASVREFTAPEGVVLAPDWAMRRLKLVDDDGSVGSQIVRVSALPPRERPPLGTSARLRPRRGARPNHGDFLAEVDDPKAVLELRLRDFICLSVGDEIELNLDGRHYVLDIVELRPAPSVCIVDCDLAVDFDIGGADIEEIIDEDTSAVPEAAMASSTRNPHHNPIDAQAESNGSLSGNCSTTVSTAEVDKAAAVNDIRGRPNFDYKSGTLTFPQHRSCLRTAQKDVGTAAAGPKFTAFNGIGRTLGGSNSASRTQSKAPKNNTKTERAGHCIELPFAPNWA